MNQPIFISLILPAYNEVNTIGQTIAEAQIYFRHKGFNPLLVQSLWALSGCVLLASFVRPALLQPAEKCLIRIGDFMAPIFTRIILTLLFFLIVTPVALLMRLLGKQPLPLRQDRQNPTYWVTHDATQSERHERQY